MENTYMTVVSHKALTSNIYELMLKGSLAHEAKPGQFVHLRMNRQDLVLRRPISIASIQKEQEQLTLLYRIVGEGTKWLSTLQENDQIEVLGPLGHGFPVDKQENKVIYLIGGGIGIPPLYECAKQLRTRGNSVVALLGYRSVEDSYYIEEFQKVSDVHIVTEDGSLGTHGHIGHLMEALTMPDVVFACGPHAMLKAVQTYYDQLDEVYLSLEARMACGLGACYGCVVESTTPDTMLKVCHDGPVFKGSQVKL